MLSLAGACGPSRRAVLLTSPAPSVSRDQAPDTLLSWASVTKGRLRQLAKRDEASYVSFSASTMSSSEARAAPVKEFTTFPEE